MDRSTWGAVGWRLITATSVIVLLAVSLLFYYNSPVHSAYQQTITRQRSPTADVASPDGDANGFETTPANAYADGGGYAVDALSGKNNNSVPTGTGCDKHSFYDYGLPNVIPTGSTISGITVRADIAVDSLTDSPSTAIRLSYDGGTSWTSVVDITLTATAETTYTYGGPANNWGYAWTTSQLTDALFRVQVINCDQLANGSNRTFSLDWIPVSITFTAPWESYEDSGRTIIRDTFDATNYTVYMKGTGFTDGTNNYQVAYYDAGGNWIAAENPSVSSGVLNSQYDLRTNSAQGDNYWYALVQPASGYLAFVSSLSTVTGSPDTYGLVANDGFYVAASAIPEIPTILASVSIAGLCAAAYYWMRKRARLKVQKAG